MNIMVCIKQVPETRKVKIDPETHTLIRQGVESMINPFDLFAVEAALRLKDEKGGKVVAVTMGPPQAEEALREVVALGVDEVALFSDRAFAGADTWATSYVLAQGARKLGPFDLIVCGKQAVDGDTAQVGPGLAERLGWPYVAFVRRIRGLDGRDMVVERLMDDGYDVVRFAPPALLTVVKEIGEIRVPSFKGKMRAKNLKVPVLSAADIEADPEMCGLKGSATRVIKVFAPKPREKRELWEGEAEELAQRLLHRLSEDKIISIAV